MNKKQKPMYDTYKSYDVFIGNERYRFSVIDGRPKKQWVVAQIYCKSTYIVGQSFRKDLLGEQQAIKNAKLWLEKLEIFGKYLLKDRTSNCVRIEKHLANLI